LEQTPSVPRGRGRLVRRATAFYVPTPDNPAPACPVIGFMDEHGSFSMQIPLAALTTRKSGRQVHRPGLSRIRLVRRGKAGTARPKACACGRMAWRRSVCGSSCKSREFRSSSFPA